MNENIKINNVAKRKAIFRKLMAFKLNGVYTKTREATLRELKELERQGQLKIYVPEEK